MRKVLEVPPGLHEAVRKLAYDYRLSIKDATTILIGHALTETRAALEHADILVEQWENADPPRALLKVVRIERDKDDPQTS